LRECEIFFQRRHPSFFSGANFVRLKPLLDSCPTAQAEKISGIERSGRYPEDNVQQAADYLGAAPLPLHFVIVELLEHAERPILQVDICRGWFNTVLCTVSSFVLGYFKTHGADSIQNPHRGFLCL